MIMRIEPEETLLPIVQDSNVPRGNEAVQVPDPPSGRRAPLGDFEIASAASAGISAGFLTATLVTHCDPAAQFCRKKPTARPQTLLTLKEGGQHNHEEDSAMKRLLSTTALLALLTIPAAAQDATQTKPEMQMSPNAPMEEPAIQSPAAPGEPMGLQSETAAAPAADLPKFIAEQAQDQTLASELMGAPVYGKDDNKLGDVADIVFGPDHETVALVIGVGGFLGIGEKQVGVSLSQFGIEQDADGKPALFLEATAEELEAAAAFTTLDEAKAAAEAELQRQQQQQTLPPAQSPRLQ